MFSILEQIKAFDKISSERGREKRKTESNRENKEERDRNSDREREIDQILGLADPGLDDIDGHRRKRARERQK